MNNARHMPCLRMPVVHVRRRREPITVLRLRSKLGGLESRTHAVQVVDPVHAVGATLANVLNLECQLVQLGLELVVYSPISKLANSVHVHVHVGWLRSFELEPRDKSTIAVEQRIAVLVCLRGATRPPVLLTLLLVACEERRIAFAHEFQMLDAHLAMLELALVAGAGALQAQLLNMTHVQLALVGSQLLLELSETRRLLDAQVAALAMRDVERVDALVGDRELFAQFDGSHRVIV